MKLKIQDYCIRCGWCEEYFGEVFELDQEADCIRVKYDEIPEELEPIAKKAISQCHVAAIHLVKDKPYAKYLDLPVDEISEEKAEEIEDSFGDEEDALELKDRAKLMSKESYPAEPGYYPLEGGGVLVASNVFMPGVTAEMINWWGPWHSLDPIRYMIWNPEDHENVEVDAVGKARALDKSIPNEEKLWGATHVDIESLGGPADKVTIHFANPADMGYDASKIGTEDCSAFLCGNAGMGDMMVIPTFMSESFLEHDGGLEVRARFWIGYNIIDGEPQYLLPPEIPIPGDVCVGLIKHNIREFTQLAKILPELYAEYQDKWIV